MKAVGEPSANVQMCLDPLLHGVHQALTWENIAAIIDQYRWQVDLFLLIVDRDGEPNRRASLDWLEQQSPTILPEGKTFLSENAWQEVEVWALAGHKLPKGWSWKAIREEIHPKERYFDPYAKQRGCHTELGGGRKTLAEDAARRYDRIRQRCPEDVAALEYRVRAWIVKYS